MIVEMNANSSSGAKKTTNRTVSSMITRSRTSNTKRKADSALISNKKSSLDEIETGGAVSGKNKWLMILWACIREKKLRTYFWVICESTDIQFGGRSIPNHSGKKTVIQVLKELGYSDSVVMLITRHKSQKGLAAYERLKTVMQQEGINRFFRALMVVNNGEGSYK
ncbi:20148_t:CDS:2, partial [Gigaspora rosea]